MEFKYYNITPDQSPQDFFSWCLDNKLYKYDGGRSFDSRMKAVYSGVEPFRGVCAVVAFKKNRPVAIALCEHRPLELLKNVHQESSNSFCPLGFLSLYVKLSHRRKGLATSLVHEMENFRLSLIKEEIRDKTQVWPFFISRAWAKKIVTDKSVYSYAVGSDIGKSTMDLEINHLDYSKKTKDEDFKIKEKVDWGKLSQYVVTSTGYDNKKRNLRI